MSKIFDSIKVSDGVKKNIDWQFDIMDEIHVLKNGAMKRKFIVQKYLKTTQIVSTNETNKKAILGEIDKDCEVQIIVDLKSQTSPNNCIDVNINTLIDILSGLKNEGATHVEINDNSIMLDGYQIIASEMRAATEEECEREEKRIREHHRKLNERRIHELEMELLSLREDNEKL